MAEGDQEFFKESQGIHLLPYLYFGAKHMVTGYDHLLFLLGDVFFLYRVRDVGLYVTLFAVGHSTTLLLGVLNGWHINPYFVDAIIGLSIVYRAFDNLGGFVMFLRVQPNKKATVLIFGFAHGLFPNMIALMWGLRSVKCWRWASFWSSCVGANLFLTQGADFD